MESEPEIHDAIPASHRQQMVCSVCGGDAGRWEQHWNRDAGCGLCMGCRDWLISRGETDEQLLHRYGRMGINYGVVSHD
jgi:hypothetical protein